MYANVTENENENENENEIGLFPIVNNPNKKKELCWKKYPAIIIRQYWRITA